MEQEIRFKYSLFCILLNDGGRRVHAVVIVTDESEQNLKTELKRSV